MSGRIRPATMFAEGTILMGSVFVLAFAAAPVVGAEPAGGPNKLPDQFRVRCTDDDGTEYATAVVPGPFSSREAMIAAGEKACERPRAAAAPASVQQVDAPAGKPPGIGEVTLESGLTLQDWLTVMRGREPEPSVATGAKAAEYVRRYGPYRELLDVVYRAAQRPELTQVTAAGAAGQLQTLLQVRRQLGDWPELVLASARARAVTGDGRGAIADLRRVLAVLPAGAPQRREIAEQLLVAESDPAPALAWLREPVQEQAAAEYAQTGWTPPDIPVGLRRRIPAVLQSFLGEMRMAAACMGQPRGFSDFEIDWDFGSRRNQATHWVVETGHHLLQHSNRSEDLVSHVSVNGPVGLSWTTWDRRDKNSRVSTSRVVAKDVRCEGRLFPAQIGQRFTITYRSTLAEGDVERPRSAADIRDVIDVVAGPLSPAQIEALAPRIRIDPVLRARSSIYEIRYTRSSTQLFKEEYPPYGAPDGTHRGFLFDGLPFVLVMPDVLKDVKWSLVPTTGTPPADLLQVPDAVAGGDQAARSLVP